MTTSRRTFIRTAVAGSAAPVVGPRLLDTLERRLEAYEGLPPAAAATEESFWREVRKAFPPHLDYVNLENGYSSPPCPGSEAAPTASESGRHVRAIGWPASGRRAETAPIQCSRLAPCDAWGIIGPVSAPSGYSGHPVPGSGPSDNGRHVNSDPSRASCSPRMAAFLRGILCPDGDVPLLGDSARGFGAPPERLLDVAAAAPPGRAVRSRLHLHPAVHLVEGPTAGGRHVVACSSAGFVRIQAEQPLEVERGRASRQYGLIEPTTIRVQTLAAGAASAGNVCMARYSIVPLDGV